MHLETVRPGRARRLAALFVVCLLVACEAESAGPGAPGSGAVDAAGGAPGDARDARAPGDVPDDPADLAGDVPSDPPDAPPDAPDDAPDDASDGSADIPADVPADVPAVPADVPDDPPDTGPPGPTDEPVDVLGEASFVIVTTEALAPAFERLADWRRRTGLATQVVTMARVRSEATGRDDAEALRRWLRQAVTERGTRIVLLGGDTPLVPHRTVWVETVIGLGLYSYETSAWAATELYFSDLDGEWDGDGDGTYGEFTDGLEMWPDLAVGRVPAATPAEAEAYVDKVLDYESAAAADYQDRVLFLSEYTGYGNLDASLLLDTWDRQIFGPDYDIEKLYDDPSHYPDARQNTWEDEIRALEAGVGIVAHLGHGSEESFAFLDLGDVAALDHAPRYNAFFSCACYSGNFAASWRTTGEEFVLNPRGGGVLYVGNTDIGIGFPSGAVYLAQLLRLLLAPDPPRVGEAFAEARSTFVPGGGGTFVDLHADRYTQFVIVLLGDPALRMWRGRPVEPTLAVPDRHRAGDPFTLTVRDAAGAPAADATVTLYRPDALLVVTRTDATGAVRFAALDVPPGPLDVTVSGAELRPTTVTVGVE